MVAWQVILKTIGQNRDVIATQEADGRRNARDAYRAVVAEFNSTTVSGTTSLASNLLRFKMSDAKPPQVRVFAAELVRMNKMVASKVGHALPDHFLLSIFLEGLPHDYGEMRTQAAMKQTLTFAEAVVMARKYAVYKGLETMRGDTDPPGEKRGKQEVYAVDDQDQRQFNKMFKIAIKNG